MERRRTRRCSPPASRPSRTSAAISTRSPASAARSRASRGSGTRATPASSAWSRSSIRRATTGSNPGDGEEACAREVARSDRASSTDDLQFYDLTHRWGHGMPQWPSRANLNVRVVEFHAKDGLLVQQFEGIMHRGTHMDAPIHVQENQPTLTGYPLWRFFGTGVVVSIPKGKWGVITPKDLENAEPKIRKNDIVMINTGSHTQLRRQSGLLRLFARPLQGGGRMDRRARRQARRHRRAGARPSARHVPRAARARARRSRISTTSTSPRPAATSSTTSRTGSRRTRS